LREAALQRAVSLCMKIFSQDAGTGLDVQADFQCLLTDKQKHPFIQRPHDVFGRQAGKGI